MKRIKFDKDTARWVFPLSFRLTCVGNDNRLYTFNIDFLCFTIIFCIDEDSYCDWFSHEGGSNDSN